MSTSLLKAAAPLFLLAQPAIADINFPDFSSTSGLTLAGSASRSGSVLRLTPSDGGQVGVAWFSQRQNVVDPFVCEFTVRMVGAADGMAFVIQRSAQNASGSAGGSLGYSGISNSIAIELDTFVNGADPSDNHVAVHTEGTGPNSADAPAVVVSGLVLISTTGRSTPSESSTRSVRCASRSTARSRRSRSTWISHRR